MLSVVLVGIYIDTIYREYKNDGKVYIATLIGMVIAIVNFIIMVANCSVSDFYSSFHLLSVLVFKTTKSLGSYILYCVCACGYCIYSVYYVGHAFFFTL